MQTPFVLEINSPTLKSNKTKKTILLIIVSTMVVTIVHAQKWSDLTQEQEVMKAKEFRADNQKYLKDSLGMSGQQATDIDNVNLCFLGTLDRIDRYAKDQATREKYAKALADVRWRNWM
ncbi:MAG: hypothetical protein ACHQEM_03940 [Chitinophagales bacterium]